MRTTFFIAVLILNALSSGFVSAQTKQVAPVPGDPLELATGPATIADTPEKRSAILNLLERARQNNNLHVSGMNPFDLKASFNSSGSAGNSGAGVLEESWLSGATWRFGSPMRFPQVVKNNLAAAATSVVQPIIIHAMLDVSGRVLEAEPLQTADSACSDAALKLVKNTNYGPMRNREHVQRDVFINVQFVAAQ